MRRTTVAALVAVPLLLGLFLWLQLNGHVGLALLMLLLGILAALGAAVWEWRHGHPRWAIGLAVGAVLVSGGLGWYGWALNAELDNIPRLPDEVLGVNEDERPERADTEAVNVLLMGADDEKQLVDKPTIAEMLADDDWVVGNYRSDTLMFVHVPADRKAAFVVSIPRDTYTTILDDEGTVDDHTDDGKNKINAAFSYYGPYATLRTVESLTDVRIDHMAIIDYPGFRDLTEALGGVEVYVPETVTDTYLDKTWTKGTHVLEGNDALLYVRQRHGLEEGDFSRIDRQQNFLRALLAKLMDDGTIGNPVTFKRTIAAVASQLTVDASWSSGDIRSLALSLRGVDREHIHFLTLPLKEYADTPVGQANIVDEAAVRDLFAAVERDRVARWVKQHPDSVLPDPNEVQ